MLYTIIPVESIFESETDIQEDVHDEVEIGESGASLMVQSLPGGKYKVIRIISTDPQDYLKPQWQPGTIISSL
jgi:ribosomal protein S12